MNTKLAFFLILPLIFILGSCGKSSSDPDITHIPVRMKEDGNWSLLDIKTGKVLFEGEFKNSPSIVTDGIFITKNTDGKMFYNKIENDKKFVQLAGPFQKANAFTEGIAIVCKEDDYVSAINQKGDELFKLKPENGVTFDQVGQCYDGMILFKDQNGYFGYLNSEGKIAIKPQYDFADDFKDGKARVAKNKDGKNIVQVIDKKGEELMNADHAYVGPAQGDLIAYSDSRDKYGVLKIGKDKEKLIKASDKYEKILIDKGEIFYCSDREWGLLDKKGEIKIRAKYRSLSKLDESTFLGIKADGSDRKFEILDEDGDVLKTEDVDEAFSLHNGNFIIVEGKHMELMNNEGEPVDNASFKRIGDMDDYIQIISHVSNMTSSLYLDWSAIENTLKGLQANTILGVGVSENCIEVEKKLESLGNSSGNGNKTGKSKGITGGSTGISMRGYEEQRYIGSGYGKSDLEYDRIARDTMDTYVPTVPDYDYSSGSQSTPLDDKAPQWTTYQKQLTHQVNLGKSGSMNMEFRFNDYIKRPVKKTEQKTYLGYTYPSEKTIGYEKNDKALLESVYIRYYMNDQGKKDKMKELVEAHFKSNGFTLSDGSSYGQQVYKDANGNLWTVSENSITFNNLKTSPYQIELAPMEAPPILESSSR